MASAVSEPFALPSRMAFSMHGGGVFPAVAGQQERWRWNRRGSGVILAVAGQLERCLGNGFDRGSGLAAMGGAAWLPFIF